jgi:hypothetical protein
MLVFVYLCLFSESLIEAAKQGNLGIIKILVGKKKLSLETEG